MLLARAVAAAVGVDPLCAKVKISTIDSAWALFTGTNTSGCQPGDGFIALRRDATGAFAVEVQGGFDRPACPYPRLPPAVGLDFKVCTKAKTYLLCLPSLRASRRGVRERPRRCNTLGPTDAFAFAVNLVGLRWRGWGKPAAKARGIERGFHRPLAHIPVRVKAWRKRKACGGHSVYTRLSATSRYGTTKVRLPARCGD